MEDEDYYDYSINTKYDLIKRILENNFTDSGFTVEGVIRFLPRRLDYYGKNYGWGDIETQQRFFIHMLNIKGYLNYLERTQSHLK